MKVTIAVWALVSLLVGCLVASCSSESFAPGALSGMHCERAQRYGKEHCFCIYNGINRTAVTWAPMDMCRPLKEGKCDE